MILSGISIYRISAFVIVIILLVSMLVFPIRLTSFLVVSILLRPILDAFFAVLSVASVAQLNYSGISVAAPKKGNKSRRIKLDRISNISKGVLRKKLLKLFLIQLIGGIILLTFLVGMAQIN